MQIIFWIILGLFSGFLVAIISKDKNSAIGFDMLLGLIGAVMGGVFITNSGFDVSGSISQNGIFWVVMIAGMFIIGSKKLLIKKV